MAEMIRVNDQAYMNSLFIYSYVDLSITTAVIILLCINCFYEIFDEIFL